MYIEHPKALTLFLVQVLMVHLVCPADSSYIGVITPSKPFETLVNDHIMDHKISRSVRHNAKADGLHPPYAIKGTKKDQQHTGNGEDDKEPVILFKEPGLFLMVIAVQVPKQAMHDILMGKPGNAFHDQEGGQ